MHHPDILRLLLGLGLGLGPLGALASPAPTPNARAAAAAEAYQPLPAAPGLAGFTLAARADTDTKAPAPTATDAQKSPATCFTTTSVTVTDCPTTNGPDGKRPSCSDKVVPSAVCAAGLICRTDRDGNPSCMYEQGMGLAGIIIAIVLGSAVGISVASICFFCIKEKRVQKKLVRAAEAAKMAMEAKTSARAARANMDANDAADGQPLMASVDGHNSHHHHATAAPMTCPRSRPSPDSISTAPPLAGAAGTDSRTRFRIGMMTCIR